MRPEEYRASAAEGHLLAIVAAELVCCPARVVTAMGCPEMVDLEVAGCWRLL